MVMMMMIMMMMIMMMMMVNVAIPPLIGWCWNGMIRSSPVWPEDLPEDDETCRLRGPWFGLDISFGSDFASCLCMWCFGFVGNMFQTLWEQGLPNIANRARLGRAMVCLWSLPQLDPKAWSLDGNWIGGIILKTENNYFLVVSLVKY